MPSGMAENEKRRAPFSAYPRRFHGSVAANGRMGAWRKSFSWGRSAFSSTFKRKKRRTMKEDTWLTIYEWGAMQRVPPFAKPLLGFRDLPPLSRWGVTCSGIPHPLSLAVSPTAMQRVRFEFRRPVSAARQAPGKCAFQEEAPGFSIRETGGLYCAGRRAESRYSSCSLFLSRLFSVACSSTAACFFFMSRRFIQVVLYFSGTSNASVPQTPHLHDRL